MLKSFQEFILEQEEVQKEETPKEESPKTKDIVIGKTPDGQKIRATMKLENTIELSEEEIVKLRNMKVTQYQRDMLTHMRGEKEYKISKGKDGKFTVWHHNQTLHKLLPVGAFVLPEKKESESTNEDNA